MQKKYISNQCLCLLRWRILLIYVNMDSFSLDFIQFLIFFCQSAHKMSFFKPFKTLAVRATPAS